jgi:putative transposase
MYPTREQEQRLLNTAGAARYAYNWGLATWKGMYAAWMEDHSKEKPSAFKLCTLWTANRPSWANETAYGPQQNALLNLGKAFQNLWRGTGKYPTPHKKGRKDSFTINYDKAKLYGSIIQLPKIGHVRLAEALRFGGKITSYTVSHYAGQWHVSVNVELQDELTSITNPTSVVGIDVGLSHAAVASDGTVCNIPESLKKLDVKLRKAQKAVNRKLKGSKNRSKALLKEQRIQNKINNIRKDVTHKFTTAITKSHGIVVTEDLHIQEMKDRAQFRSLRRSFNSSMMGMILQQLKYKALEYHTVDRFFPSTKKCSVCGAVKPHIDLSERVYKCEHCGAVIDRDLNAALNLKNAGPVRPVAPVDSAGSR